ncbi:Uncharacterised protein [Mycobacteroides abscessus subsp. abscessus]|nr:Uncharacterised protein [Mycobacteroides abscessus subsp. abscessus]
MVITKSSLIRVTWRLFTTVFDYHRLSKIGSIRRYMAIFWLSLTVPDGLC